MPQEGSYRKRFLFCTHDIEFGGSPRSMAILVGELAKRHEIRIVTMREPHPGNPAFQKYRQMGIPVYYFPWGWLPVSYVNLPVNIGAHMENTSKMEPFAGQFVALCQDQDLVCVNGYPAASLAAIVPRHIPRVLLAREIVLDSAENYKEIWRYLRANISAAVAIGPLEAAQLRNFGIPNITVFNSASNPPHKRAMPPLPARFGVFSRFGRGKGIETIARAIALAAATLREHGASVHIFGGNSAQPNALELDTSRFCKDFGIQDICKIHDYTAQPDNDMAACHCIVRPDDSGSPWGRDIIEAMSIGRPVLATGTLQVFIKPGKTGWLVPPMDSRGMARVLEELCARPEMILAAGDNAANFAAANFDPARNSRRIEEYLLSQL